MARLIQCDCCGTLVYSIKDRILRGDATSVSFLPIDRSTTSVTVTMELTIITALANLEKADVCETCLRAAVDKLFGNPISIDFKGEFL